MVIKRDRVAELKELIATADPTDGFSRLDIQRWQAELNALLPRANAHLPGTWKRPTGKTIRAAPGHKPGGRQARGAAPIKSALRPPKPVVPPVPSKRQDKHTQAAGQVIDLDEVLRWCERTLQQDQIGGNAARQGRVHSGGYEQPS